MLFVFGGTMHIHKESFFSFRMYFGNQENLYRTLGKCKENALEMDQNSAKKLPWCSGDLPGM